jgi:hypothetical protein
MDPNTESEGTGKGYIDAQGTEQSGKYLLIFKLSFFLQRFFGIVV